MLMLLRYKWSHAILHRQFADFTYADADNFPEGITTIRVDTNFPLFLDNGIGTLIKRAVPKRGEVYAGMSCPLHF